MLKSRRRKTLAALAALALVGVSVAVAAWLISGTGNSTARAGQLQALSVDPIPLTGGTELFPGSNGSLAFQVGNPNGEMIVTGIVQAGAVTTGTPGCPANNHVQVTGGVASGLNLPLPPGVTQFTVPNAVNMTSDTPTACQGASFTVPITVTATTP